MEVQTSDIQALRSAFLQELAVKGDNAVHSKDLERVRTDDSWLKRFLLHHDLNQKEALNMMWETVTWRKEFRANEIKDLVKMDLIVQGGFFPHGRDKDGCILFIFKCKKYVKNANPIDELKRCVVYWLERIEREEKGNPLTLFFDMEGCGLANMDMEFIKYLIGLFKQYYPFFLNYILIFEMPWVLSAAFKIIKTWLPEKAVQKIKFVSKKDIKEFVPLDQALTCWGGQDDYTFNYLPEKEESEVIVASNVGNNRKVHFSDGTSMLESPESGSGKEHDGGPLRVQPTGIITFNQEGGELVSCLELQNVDSSIILSYKLKTTSPEKFRVRPSVGCLTPGSRTSIHVTLLQGFHLGGLSKDKFLIMSMTIEPSEMNQDLSHLWKDTSGRKVNQHRLRCTQTAENTNNGNVVSGGGSGDSEVDHHSVNQLSISINKLMECQSQLHKAVRRTQYCQYATFFVILIIGIVLAYLINFVVEKNCTNSYCPRPDPI